jgi:hypothetical protein
MANRNLTAGELEHANRLLADIRQRLSTLADDDPVLLFCLSPQDPALVHGSSEEQERAFNRAFRELDARIKIFTSLRLDALDRLSLQRQLDEIGKLSREPEPTHKAD